MDGTLDDATMEMMIRVAHVRMLWVGTASALVERGLLGRDDLARLREQCLAAAAALAPGGAGMRHEVGVRCAHDIDALTRAAIAAA